MANKLYGERVKKLEDYFGMTLTELFGIMDDKGMTYAQQCIILRTPKRTLLDWRALLNLPKHGIRKELDITVDDLCRIAGLRRPSEEDNQETFGNF